ncbi:MAG: nucleotidyltransferase family protein [Candidatus Woesearchaeota archaeon]|nr:nucleotidyltransferase family protein [Candidatus Woesearchaeota archaeon]
MQAVILAAGEGTRLRPLTLQTPKAMVPINGRPMLEILLSQLKSAGISDVVIVVYYLKEKIMDYFGDGSKFGMKIKYAVQQGIKGSADAVAQAEPFVTDKRFFVIACDSLFETDLLKRVMAHKSEGMFTCKEVEDGRRYGILITEGKRVKRIIEKPEVPPSNLANFSVYIFPGEIFDACKKVPAGLKGEHWLPDAIQLLIDKGVVFEYEISKHILDIGTPEQLAEAQDLARKLGL